MVSLVQLPGAVDGPVAEVAGANIEERTLGRSDERGDEGKGGEECV